MQRELRIWILLAAGFGCCVPAAAQDITSNLRGHWRLTETSGTSAADSSSYGNNGTYTNGVSLAASTTVPGHGVEAALFDGNNDYVAMANESHFDITGSITVAVWIRVSSFTKDLQAIVCKGNSAWRLARDGSTNFVQFTCTNLSTIKVVSATSVNDGKWHHVVGVYTGSQLRIYIDGALDNTANSTGSIGTNNYAVEVGRNAESTSREYHGAAYDLRVYNRALSATDIAYLYSLGLPDYHWKFNEGSGTSVADSGFAASHAAFSSSAPTWINGVRGKALQFDGVDDAAATSDSITPPTTATIAFWFLSDGAVSSRERLFGINSNWEAFTDSDGILRLDMGFDGDNAGFKSSTALTQAGRWYHIAGVFNQAAGTFQLYVDGALDASGSATINATAAAALTFGTRTGNTERFSGALDDFRIYKRTLSASEIAEVYGFLAQWKLDQTSGTTATDSSPGANHGTYTNGVTLNAAGPFPGAGDKAASFDGVNDYVAIPNESRYDISGMVTVAAWIKVTSFTIQWQAIVGKGDSSWRLTRDSSNNGVSFACTGLSTLRVASVRSVNDGQWHHVVGVYNGSQLLIYIDGVLDNSVNSTGTISLNNFPVEIGRNAEASGREFHGSMYDVRIYDRALTSADIAEMYGLVGHWKFDASSGTAVADSSGLGNNGTLTGTVGWTTGAVDGGHLFNYTDGQEYVTLPNSTSLENVQEGSFTLTAWFKPLSTPPGSGSNNNAGYGIISKEGYHTGFWYSNSNTFECSHYLTGNVWTGTGTWSNTYAAGTFYHVAMVVNRPGGTIRIYVDGVLKNTGNFTANTAAREYGTLPWWIGIADPDGSTYRFPAHGVIDDARIYNRAVSLEEVQALHGMGSTPFVGVKIIKWVEIQ